MNRSASQAIDHQLFFAGILLACMVLTSCSRSAELKSYVSIPTSIPALEEFGKKNGALVQVERRQKSSGGANCGHSPVCLIVIPFVIAGALFPEKYDVAIATRGQIEIYSGIFSTDGKFVQARTTEPDGIHEFRRLDLPKLHRSIIVEIAKGKEEASIERVPLLPQTHLDEDYRKSIFKSGSQDDRSDLLAEAVDWMGSEADPLVKSVLDDQAFGDLALARFMSYVCEDTEKISSFVRATSLDAALKSSDVTPALNALSCFPSEDPKAAPFLRRLAHNVCENAGRSFSYPSEAVRWGGHSSLSVSSLKKRIAGDIDGELSNCKLPAARVLWQAALDIPFTREDFETAMRDDSFRREITSHLDMNLPEERAGLFRLVQSGEDGEAAIRRLESLEWTAQGQELEAIARQYMPVQHSVFSSSDYGRRASILKILHDQKASPQAASVLSVFESEIPKTPSERLAEIRIAQVVLGHHEYALSAARALKPTSRHHLTGVKDAGDLVYFGLGLAGCNDKEIRDAYYSSRNASDQDRGKLCTK